MSNPSRGAKLPTKPEADQLKELENLQRYLRDACDGYHKAGDRDLAVVMGETARRIGGTVQAIRNRVEIRSTCCRTRWARGSCSCSDGLP